MTEFDGFDFIEGGEKSGLREEKEDRGGEEGGEFVGVG
jgi:hypothetical protein